MHLAGSANTVQALTAWNSMSQSRGAITQNLKKIQSTVLITKNYTKLLHK